MKQSSAEPLQSRAAGSTRMAMRSNHRRPQVMERGSTLQKPVPIASTSIHAWRGWTVSTKVDTYQQR
ncbi:hypothetical protein, partial [Stenotrophomonas maltophilia]|uniref:hypothetical protein n=1 Tax=Stenotrophomonas maltophilia TaxID=40324 RepID=UPI0019540BC3